MHGHLLWAFFIIPYCILKKKSGERSTTMAISVHFFKNILYSNKTDNASSSNTIQIAMTSSKRPQAIQGR